MDGGGLHRALRAPLFEAGPAGWYALTVAAQREDQAEAWLARRGVYAFHPVVVRRVVQRGRRREYLRRYLPGYVFARFPGLPVAHRVLDCPFVTGALALQSGVWGRLDPRDLRAIHAMRKVEDAAAARRSASVRSRLSVGCAALFRTGPLAGLRCEVAEVSGAGVLVTLSLFGGEVSARAECADLVPLDPVGGGSDGTMGGDEGG